MKQNIDVLDTNPNAGKSRRIPPSRRIIATDEYLALRHEALVEHDVKNWDKKLALREPGCRFYGKRWTNEAGIEDQLLQKIEANSRGDNAKFCSASDLKRKTVQHTLCSYTHVPAFGREYYNSKHPIRLALPAKDQGHRKPLYEKLGTLSLAVRDSYKLCKLALL